MGLFVRVGLIFFLCMGLNLCMPNRGVDAAKEEPQVYALDSQMDAIDTEFEGDSGEYCIEVANTGTRGSVSYGILDSSYTALVGGVVKPGKSVERRVSLKDPAFIDFRKQLKKKPIENRDWWDRLLCLNSQFQYEGNGTIMITKISDQSQKEKME